MLPIKAHFFLVYAAAAPVVPFVPIYAKQMGIDTLGVGVIFAGDRARPDKMDKTPHFSFAVYGYDSEACGRVDRRQIFP